MQNLWLYYSCSFIITCSDETGQQRQCFRFRLKTNKYTNLLHQLLTIASSQKHNTHYIMLIMLGSNVMMKTIIIMLLYDPNLRFMNSTHNSWSFSKASRYLLKKVMRFMHRFRIYLKWLTWKTYENICKSFAVKFASNILWSYKVMCWVQSCGSPAKHHISNIIINYGYCVWSTEPLLIKQH